MFTQEELEMKKFRRTAFYQEIVFHKLEDIIIDKQFRVTRAAEHLGENWNHVEKYLSTAQKDSLHQLVKKYGRNGGKRLRRISTSIPQVI